MYLNGTHLKALAHVQHLSQSDVQQRSGLSMELMEYYWTYPVTVTSQEDVDALARVFQVAHGDLLAHGEQHNVPLRSDKFVSEEGDITFIKKAPKVV